MTTLTLDQSVPNIKPKRNKPGRRKTDFAKASGQDVLCRAEIKEEVTMPHIDSEVFTADLQAFIDYDEAKDKKSSILFWGIALAEIVVMIILN